MKYKNLWFSINEFVVDINISNIENVVLQRPSMGIPTYFPSETPGSPLNLTVIETLDIRHYHTPLTFMLHTSL